ncbi:hypothetical protein DL764_001136 [Monosporascus ibericus]|uniref:Uncharacterized protein n=1 Tax=Monosporascus ibericus TaxID=155417 RepID=A0A4Q4TVP9_9PEZI|nr:hypothetical protein DL764_001136 [Monosporascus ibericus]
MSGSSQNAACNGHLKPSGRPTDTISRSAQQAKGQHKYSSGDVGTSAIQRVHEFMRTTNEGGDPITALPFRAAASPQQTITASQARAQRKIAENMAKFSGQKK